MRETLMSTLLTSSKESEHKSTAVARESVGDRLKHFLNPFDARFEEMRNGNWLRVASRYECGLLVAMMAIPMAMGFAIASGLRPEHGILAGAIAGVVGATGYGGSRFLPLRFSSTETVQLLGL